MRKELPPLVQALLSKSQQHYQQHARLMLTVDTLTNDKVAWCSARQEAPAVNSKVFTAPEILERATEAFAALRDAGYTPIISLYTLENCPPEEPITEHRMAGDIELRGLKAAVLRQSPPRILFTQEGDELKLLAAEDIGSLHFFAQLADRANAWLKLDRYRK